MPCQPRCNLADDMLANSTGIQPFAQMLFLKMQCTNILPIVLCITVSQHSLNRSSAVLDEKQQTLQKIMVFL